MKKENMKAATPIVEAIESVETPEIIETEEVVEPVEPEGKQEFVVSSPIVEAIENIRLAQEHIAAVARERAAKQLSIGSLAAIGNKLNQIVRRMSVYVKG